MSDFRATAASNTFRVLDIKALRDALNGIPVKIHTAIPDGDPNHVYLVADTDNGCWPCERPDERTERSRHFDLLGLIGEHLAEDEVAVLKEAGQHELRQISANALAINERGERAEVNLEQIFSTAEQLLGGNIAADI